MIQEDATIPAIDPTKSNILEPNKKIDNNVPDDSKSNIDLEPHPKSGLYNAIKQYKDNDEGGDEDEEIDDSSGKNTGEKGVLEGTEKKTHTTDGGADEDNDGEETPPQEPSKKLEEMSTEELIEELKKNQRLASERDVKIKELETKIAEPQEVVKDEKLKSFIEELKSNPIKAWNDFKKEFNLPDTDLLKASLSNDPEEQLLAWQKNVLTKQIEKEFNLQEGEFEVVKEDLYTPKTPSYRWRQLTEQKEKELFGKIDKIRAEEQQRIEQIKQSQEQDIKYFADTFLDGNLDDARSKVAELNEIPKKIADGELEQSNHPFSLRNLMRGAFFDELVEKEKTKAQEEIIKQFNDKGLYLTSKELPTNLKQVGGGDETNTKPLDVPEDLLKYSPMYRTMYQDTIKTNK